MNKKLFMIVTIFGFITLSINSASVLSMPYKNELFLSNQDSLIVENYDVELVRECAVPSYLCVGDLLFCDIKPCFANEDSVSNAFDHVAMYVGENKFIEATNYSFLNLGFDLEGTLEGVRNTSYWVIRFWAENITFGKVKNASMEQKNQAVNFAFSQLGKPYQKVQECPWANPDPDDPNDFYSDWWYCSELVWASYYNQGIELDPNPPDDPDDHRYVSSQDIADDEDTENYSDEYEMISGSLYFIRKTKYL